MADERKYREGEVKEIFDLAVRRHHEGEASDSEGPGLSLEELQEVGLEVGLDPARIAEAAMAVESRRGLLPRRTFIGMPIAVGRVVDLPRALTDSDWSVLVAELQHVFAARGRVGSHGGVREWTNHNLYARLEPTGSGQRLRMGTLKGGAEAINRMGVASVGASAILVVAEVIASAMGSSILTGDIWTLRGAILPLVLASTGIGMLISNALSLPRWARAREGQMEHIAGSVGAMLEATPDDQPEP